MGIINSKFKISLLVIFVVSIVAACAVALSVSTTAEAANTNKVVTYIEEANLYLSGEREAIKNTDYTIQGDTSYIVNINTPGWEVSGTSSTVETLYFNTGQATISSLDISSGNGQMRASQPLTLYITSGTVCRSLIFMCDPGNNATLLGGGKLYTSAMAADATTIDGPEVYVIMRSDFEAISPAAFIARQNGANIKSGKLVVENSGMVEGVSIGVMITGPFIVNNGAEFYSCAKQISARFMDNDIRIYPERAGSTDYLNYNLKKEARNSVSLMKTTEFGCYSYFVNGDSDKVAKTIFAGGDCPSPVPVPVPEPTEAAQTGDSVIPLIVFGIVALVSGAGFAMSRRLRKN